MREMRTVQLPADLCAALERKYGAQFKNFEELLAFILENLSADGALKKDDDELRLVEERLRDLGYL